MKLCWRWPGIVFGSGWDGGYAPYSQSFSLFRSNPKNCRWFIVSDAAGDRVRATYARSASRMKTLEFIQIVERQKRPSQTYPVCRRLKVLVFGACGYRLSDLIV
jgi:hypothetical protein